jgi:hypothetical protein
MGVKVAVGGGGDVGVEVGGTDVRVGGGGDVTVGAGLVVDEAAGAVVGLVAPPPRLFAIGVSVTVAFATEVLKFGTTLGKINVGAEVGFVVVFTGNVLVAPVVFVITMLTGVPGVVPLIEVPLLKIWLLVP